MASQDKLHALVQRTPDADEFLSVCEQTSTGPFATCYAIGIQGDIHPFGVIAEVDDELVGSIIHGQEWNIIERSSIEHGGIRGSATEWDHSGLYIGEDAQTAKHVWEAVLNAGKSEYGESFISAYTSDDDRETYSKSQCSNHYNPDGEPVKDIAQGLQTATCPNCTHVVAVERDGEWVGINRALNESNAFENADNPELYTIHNIDDDSYFVQTGKQEGKERSWFDGLAHILVYNGHIETRSIGSYEPTQTTAYLYVEDGEIVGIILADVNGYYGPTMSVMYVRPNYRGQGIGQRMGAEWYDIAMGSNDAFYLLDVNEAGKAVFEATGLFSPDNQTGGPAIPAYEIKSAGFSIPEFIQNRTTQEGMDTPGKTHGYE